MLLAHPYLSMVNMVSNALVKTGMKPYSLSSTCYAATTRAALSDKLSNFRVVSVGYEVRNL